MDTELIEELAALEHNQWLSWTGIVMSEVSEERRERWKNYHVPYAELPEDVKSLDREWARKTLAIVLKHEKKRILALLKVV
jgi:hypothetical protein